MEPSESRTFSLVEMVVLVGGFGLAKGTILRFDDSAIGSLRFGMSLYLAMGLSLSGPVIVTWRERLGRLRPVWGVGESLWFAIGVNSRRGAGRLDRQLVRQRYRPTQLPLRHGAPARHLPEQQPSHPSQTSTEELVEHCRSLELGPVANHSLRHVVQQGRS